MTGHGEAWRGARRVRGAIYVAPGSDMPHRWREPCHNGGSIGRRSLERHWHQHATVLLPPKATFKGKSQLGSGEEPPRQPAAPTLSRRAFSTQMYLS